MSFVRKLERQPLAQDLERYIKQNPSENIKYFPTEKAMLEAFIAKLGIIDPDMIIAHNLCGGLFEVLLARVRQNQVQHWSRIGRFKR